MWVSGLVEEARCTVREIRSRPRTVIADRLDESGCLLRPCGSSGDASAAYRFYAGM